MECPRCYIDEGNISCPLCHGEGYFSDLSEDIQDGPECFGDYAPGSSTCDFCEYQEECR